MNTPKFLAGLLIAIPLCSYMINAQSPARVFYVSPNGQDNWSGKLASPNQKKSDGPFATLERARDAVRNVLRNEEAGGDVTVFLRSGTYQLERSLQFDRRDSGSPGRPVVWQSYPEEEACLIGGTAVGGWRRIADSSVTARLSPAAVPNIIQVDLRAARISDFGQITPRGGPPLELFFRGKRMTPSRWPNEGWLLIADVPQSGPKRFHDGLEREKRFDGVPIGRHYGRIVYGDNRPSRWSKDNEVFVHGYWTFDWSDTYQKVSSIDTVKHELTLAEPHHGYGYTKNQRFRFLNILEELDTPGEWYLDRRAGVMYFWPPSPPSEGDIRVSLLEQPLIIMDSVRSLTLRGITFECTRGRGIVITGCHNTLIGTCTFRNLGGDAIVI
ncbi:MAG: hypothetical protein H6Q30_2806, partial [Bacteroidetes bacterium]|nr:hypothetical protein [Bacteroidota bacterium]